MAPGQRRGHHRTLKAAPWGPALATAGAVALLAWVVLRPLAVDPIAVRRTPAAVARAARLLPSATAPPVPTATPSPTPTRAPRPTNPPAERRTATATATARPTPEPTATLVPTPAATATVALTPTAAPLYRAGPGDGLAAWSLLPSWAVVDGLLANDGTGVDAQPWLVAPYAPDGSAYAVEAEIRVEGMAAGKCGQSFGVVAGGSGGVVWGGGVQWWCDGAGPHARITDVSVWPDGYDHDRELAAAAYDPGPAWRTYRLEVRGAAVRLLVDGAPVLEATAPAVAAGGSPAGAGQIGLWSQGVQVTVRSVAVLPL